MDYTHMYQRNIRWKALSAVYRTNYNNNSNDNTNLNAVTQSYTGFRD